MNDTMNKILNQIFPYDVTNHILDYHYNNLKRDLHLDLLCKTSPVKSKLNDDAKDRVKCLPHKLTCPSIILRCWIDAFGDFDRDCAYVLHTFTYEHNKKAKVWYLFSHEIVKEIKDKANRTN